MLAHMYDKHDYGCLTRCAAALVLVGRHPGSPGRPPLPVLLAAVCPCPAGPPTHHHPRTHLPLQEQPRVLCDEGAQVRELQRAAAGLAGGVPTRAAVRGAGATSGSLPGRFLCFPLSARTDATRFTLTARGRLSSCVRPTRAPRAVHTRQGGRGAAGECGEAGLTWCAADPVSTPVCLPLAPTQYENMTSSATSPSVLQDIKRCVWVCGGLRRKARGGADACGGPGPPPLTLLALLPLALWGTLPPSLPPPCNNHHAPSGFPQPSMQVLGGRPCPARPGFRHGKHSRGAPAAQGCSAGGPAGGWGHTRQAEPTGWQLGVWVASCTCSTRGRCSSYIPLRGMKLGVSDAWVGALARGRDGCSWRTTALAAARRQLDPLPAAGDQQARSPLPPPCRLEAGA